MNGVKLGDMLGNPMLSPKCDGYHKAIGVVLSADDVSAVIKLPEPFGLRTIAVRDARVVHRPKQQDVLDRVRMVF